MPIIMQRVKGLFTLATNDTTASESTTFMILFFLIGSRTGTNVMCIYLSEDNFVNASLRL